MAARNIDESEVIEAIGNGEIIEEYSQDKYGPTCLIHGKTKVRRPLHVLISYSEPVWVITTYEPDEAKWVNFKLRRKP